MAMAVCSSRATAVDVYNVLIKMPGNKINPRVVITFGDKREGEGDEASDGAANIKEYREKRVKPLFGDNDDRYDESVCNDFKNPEGDINMLIVKDKLLTGFDAPVAGVLYVDKPLKEHSLLQAIARVNRVYKGKDFGLIVDYWGIFGKLKSALDMYDDAESEMNKFAPEDIEGAVFGPVDEKNRLEEAYQSLLELFDDLDKNASSDAWQRKLEDEIVRNDFYDRLKAFANRLNLALSNRSVFVEVGFEKLDTYRADYLFFNKLRQAVIERYDNTIDVSKYEFGIQNLLNTFVNASEIKIVVDPVYIGDEKAMEALLASDDPSNVKADKIKTRIESELKQIRYDDPLKFEEFSTKIKKTLAEYEQNRDADKYLANMESMADDFRHGRMNRDYPASIANDGDTKAFYGSIITVIRSENMFELNEKLEETIAENAITIKKAVSENAKRDWKHNEVVHKQIHRVLDDCLFDMFEQLDIVIDNSNVGILDKMIDEIMKVALTRY